MADNPDEDELGVRADSVNDVRQRLRRRVRLGRSSEDTVQSERPLPYVRFTEDDLKALIELMRDMHDGSLLPMSLSAHHKGGWYSHPDLRTLRQKVPPSATDTLRMTAIKGAISVSLGLHFSSPSYYGHDVLIHGGKPEQHEAIYKKLLDFFRLRSRGRLPAALASFATLAIGAVAVVFLLAVVIGRALHLLGAPDAVSSALMSYVPAVGSIAGLLSLVFVSAWITPHVQMEGWGRHHGRRRALKAFVLLVLGSVVAVAVEWLIRGQ